MKVFSIIVLPLLLFQFGISQTITTIAGTGIGGYSGDGGPAISAQIQNPGQLVVKPNGEIIIADEDNYRIRLINNLGIINTIAGTGSVGFSGDGGLATSANLERPWAITLDAIGNIYFGDTYNYRIRKINTSGTITTVAGNGGIGFSGDGGPATSAQFNLPIGLVSDSVGNLYISDWLNRRVRKVSSSGTITTIAGSGVNGYSGDGGLATTAVCSSPDGITIDNSGNIFFCDYFNHVIRKINTSGIISTYAGNGTQGYSGDGGLATSAQLKYPSDVDIDGSGNLFISEIGNNTIRKVNSAGIISTIVGTGFSGFSGDGGLATLAQISGPTGVAVDSFGNIFITDQGNQRIRKVTTSTLKVPEQNFENAFFEIFPNPSNDLININLTNFSAQSISVKILDIKGCELFNKNISLLQNKATIPIQDFDSGIYNLFIIYPNGMKANKRFIVSSRDN